MIDFTDYQWDTSSEDSYTLPKEVTSIEVSYDGGRLGLYINGEEVFYTSSVGIDFNLIVNNNDLENN